MPKNKPRTPEEKAEQRAAARPKRRTQHKSCALAVNHFDLVHDVACDIMGLVGIEVVAPRRLSKLEREGKVGVAHDPTSRWQRGPTSQEYAHPSAA